MNETELHDLTKETTRNIDTEPTEQTKLNPNSQNNNNNNNTNNTNDNDEEEEDEMRFPKTALEKFFYHLWLIIQTLEHYIHAIISILLSGYTIYYTNFFYNFFNNPHIDSVYFILSLLLFIIIISFISYISFYLPFKYPNETEFENQFNTLIPYLTLISLIFLLTLITAVWPLYRWYTLLIIPIIIWGLIMSANFSPKGVMGNIFFIMVCTITCLSGKFITHKGHTYI